MRFSYHILSLKTGAFIFCLFSFLLDLKSQSWIIETPSGTLSTWIIQRHPTQLQRAELLFLNHSDEAVKYDDFNINKNYLEIKSPSGLSAISRFGVYTKKLSRINVPAIEKNIRWEVDFFELINSINFKQNGNYLITWHMETSLGTLSAESVEIYFNK